LLSVSDDKSIIRWSSDGEKQAAFSLNAFVTCLGWFPSSAKQVSEAFAVGCSDGTVRFISRSGREEKKFTAHEGAVLQLKWSRDGTAIVTTGEDGDVKIWSKSGNLRSTLASLGQAVYCSSWSPDDEQLLMSSGKSLMIKSTQSSAKKNVQWNAHDGIILACDWSSTNGSIVSGGEDCVYKVWDSFGRQLYSSRPLDHVVTDIAWSPNGALFAVGSFNLVRVCDKVGWTHCRDRVNIGSLQHIAWTPDSTQFAAAGGNGAILFAQVTDRQCEWRNASVTLVSQRRLRIQDIAQETDEEIELAKDRVVEMCVGHDHLIVSTTSQCYVYTLGNLNTPIIFDTRAPPLFLHICRRHFLSLDIVAGVQIISFEGRVLSSPKHGNFRADFLTKDLCVLSPDTVAMVDTADRKSVLLFDTNSGRQSGRIGHNADVVSVGMNQTNNGVAERYVCFLDLNHDLFFCCPLTTAAGASTPIKLQSHVDSFAFNDESNVLVTMAEGVLKVWYHPEAALIDRDLLDLVCLSSVDADFGRSTQVIAFTSSRIALRKIDGAVIYASSSVELPLLDEFVRAGKWEEATRLCRVHANNNSGSVGGRALPPSYLWGSLAALAMSKKELSVAEAAYAALMDAPKVIFLQQVQALPNEEAKQSQLALFRRSPDEAEKILLQAQPPQVLRAIKLNIDMFRWGRALDLAQRYKSNLDSVIAHRQLYLQDFGVEETDARFLQIQAQVGEIDFTEIVSRDATELGETGGNTTRNSDFGRRSRK
jgi:intraflagellar transport protein 80